jgi:REP element-mobilizing transposase RayT
MKSKYKAFEEGAVYFVTSGIVDWIPVFTSDRYYGILIETLSYKKKNADMKLYAYVFMNNHFHLILSVENISKLMKEYKSYTARRIIELLKEDEKPDILAQLRLGNHSHKKGFCIKYGKRDIILNKYLARRCSFKKSIIFIKIR